ncbi:cell surface protein, partial [Lachnospiraceae bacterium OF09-6]
YSEQSYIITVTVEDNGKGQLVAAADQGLNDLVFTNEYNTADGSYTPSVKKVLKGRTLKADEFSFTITEVDENGKAVEGGYTDTKSNTADGTVSFSTIEYKEAGTHYYKVVENAGSLGGVTYSEQSYIITVTVKDNGKGQLVATADQGLNDLVFTNEYNTADGSYTPSVKKVLKGRTLK